MTASVAQAGPLRQAVRLKGNKMPGPLDGIRIIDLTTMASGPLATSILADQGADVIKIEGPGRRDGLRTIGPSRAGLSAIFASFFF